MVVVRYADVLHASWWIVLVEFFTEIHQYSSCTGSYCHCVCVIEALKSYWNIPHWHENWLHCNNNVNCRKNTSRITQASYWQSKRLNEYECWDDIGICISSQDNSIFRIKSIKQFVTSKYWKSNFSSSCVVKGLQNLEFQAGRE